MSPLSDNVIQLPVAPVSKPSARPKRSPEEIAHIKAVAAQFPEPSAETTAFLRPIFAPMRKALRDLERAAASTEAA